MRIDIDTRDEVFARVVIPKVFSSIIMSKAQKLSNSTLNNYLKEKYNVSLNYVASKIPSILSVSKIYNKFILSIDKNLATRELGGFAGEILKIIDDGNLEVKGTNLFNDTLKYVERKQKVLLSLYMKGGLNYVNRII